MGLTANTLYRYRVITVRGTASSAPSGEISVTTLAFGSFAATINQDITASRTLFADTAYTLSGFIHVLNGATLTIQPGTIIKGDFNVLGSSLMIMRGAKINAVGTADAPIVFTSSRAAGQRQPGDWGGLIIVGNAPDNRSGTVNIEGSGTDGTAIVSGKNYPVQYNGGTVATDNSGTLAYVRVEFAATRRSQDQEFNSFTFAAVGSGTRASYLESLAGLDDSYEFFGGGFDLDHLVAFETADDVLDMSEGFSGRIQFVVGAIHRAAHAAHRRRLLLGRPRGHRERRLQRHRLRPRPQLTTPFTIPLVANFTLIGCGQASCVGTGGGYGMMLRRGTGGYYVNGVVARWPSGAAAIRDAGTYTRAGSTPTPSATADLQVRNVFAADVPRFFQPAAAGTDAVIRARPAGQQSDAQRRHGRLALHGHSGGRRRPPRASTSSTSRPAANSPIATAGLSTFTGAIATKAGTFVTATPYVGGVAPGGAEVVAGLDHVRPQLIR